MSEFVELPSGCVIEVPCEPCDDDAEWRRVREEAAAIRAELLPRFRPSALTKIADADALVERRRAEREAGERARQDGGE